MGSSSLTRDWTPGPLHWELKVLATRPPGKSPCVFLNVPHEPDGHPQALGVIPAGHTLQPWFPYLNPSVLCMRIQRVYISSPDFGGPSGCPAGSKTEKLRSPPPFVIICLWGWLGFPGGAVVKNPSASAGEVRDTGSIPRSGRSPGGGYGNPLQYSCLENPMDRGAWQATVHRVAKRVGHKWSELACTHAYGVLRRFPSSGGRTENDLLPTQVQLWIIDSITLHLAQKAEKVSVRETEALFFLFQLTSQHPYAEVFIGRPHVWTIDLGNQEEVEDAVKAILSQKVVSFIPSSPLVMWMGWCGKHPSPFVRVVRTFPCQLNSGIRKQPS